MKYILAILISLGAYAQSQQLYAEFAYHCVVDLKKVSYPTTFTGESPILFTSLYDATLLSFSTKTQRLDLVWTVGSSFLAKTSLQDHEDQLTIYSLPGNAVFARFYPRSSRPGLLSQNEFSLLSDRSARFNHPFTGHSIEIEPQKVEFVALRPRQVLKADEAEAFRSVFASEIAILEEGADFAELIGQDVDLKKIAQIKERCL